MLSPKNRSYLKSLSNHLKPSIILGKGDLNQGVLESLDKALEANELVKVRLLDTVASSPDEVVDEIVNSIGAHFVGKCGHIITFYRESKKNKKIVLPRQ